jgi:hypothetical protein
MKIKTTWLLVIAGIFLTSGGVYLLISFHPAHNSNHDQTASDKQSKPVQTEPNQKSIQTRLTNPMLNRELQVSPNLGLDELIEYYEKEISVDADKEAELDQAKIRWQQGKDSGQPPVTSSERAMKEPSYYKGLDTLKLAEECFSDYYFAGRMGVFNDPTYAFEEMKFFHNAFAEFFTREDMWNGILHIYDYLLPRIDPNSTREEIFMASDNFLNLCRLYTIPVFKQQVKGREEAFLAANLRVLKRYQWYLENYDSKKYSTPGFFGEPCYVAQVALMLTKQVYPQRYSKITPALESMRWTQEQKVEDLKNFIDLIIAGLDGSVSD